MRDMGLIAMDGKEHKKVYNLRLLNKDDIIATR